MRGLPGITRIFTIRTALDIFKRPNQRRFLSDNIYHSVHSPSSESYQTFQEKKNNHHRPLKGENYHIIYPELEILCFPGPVCQMKRLRSPQCVDLLFFFWIVSLIKPLYLRSVLSLSLLPWPASLLRTNCQMEILYSICRRGCRGWNSVKIPHFTAVNPISQC